MKDHPTRPVSALVEYRMLGLKVHLIDLEGLNGAISAAAQGEGCVVIANHNLRSVGLALRDPELRGFFERADIVHFDGMGSLRLAGLLGLPVRPSHRVTYIDWIDPLASLCAGSGFRIFFLAGEPGTASSACRILVERHPGLEARGRHGFFDPSVGSAENEEVLARIREWRTDVLIVGMGMPRQEKWIAENLHAIEAKAVLTGGAIAELVTGKLPTPPRWLGRNGFDWAFRLVTKPRRVWKRYLVDPWYLVPPILRELGARRKRSRADVRVEAPALRAGRSRPEGDEGGVGRS